MFETEDGDTMSLDDFGLAETLVILNDLKEQFQSNKHSIKISQTSINNFKEHQAYEE